MKIKDLTREEIFTLVEEARAQHKNRATHVRQRLEALHPELMGQTLRRNGRTYNAIDYILGDIDSYGTSS